MENNSTETEVTTQVTETGGEQAEVVDQQEQSYNPFALVGDGSQADSVDQQKGDGEGEPESEPKQSKEDNSAARLARLKAERDSRNAVAEARKQEQEEADRRIRESGAIDPYTGKPFNSVAEFEAYGRKVKAAESGEDPETVSRTEPKEPKKNNERDFFLDDAIAFVEKYPDVDLAALDMNPSFKKFCGSRYGKESVVTLYEDYVALVHEAEKAGRAKDTRSERSTGSGAVGGAVLSSAQKRSLDEWNRRNPDMKMTAKEYLSRG